MNKMIIFKEWLKTRWVILGSAVVALAATLFCLLNLSKTIEINGAEAIWSTLLMKDTVLVEMLKYIPIAIGIVVAIAQFIPEVQRKRIKLTLHLPYPQGRMIAMMYGFGICVMLILFGLQALILCLSLGKWLTGELVARIMESWVVWFLSGIASYFFTAALCLEPTWKRRILIVLVAAGFIHFAFLSPVPGSYGGILPWVVVYVLCIQILIYSAIARFKEGLQD